MFPLAIVRSSHSVRSRQQVLVEQNAYFQFLKITENNNLEAILTRIFFKLSVFF
jgi:hypothetical protein